jgi:TorA maturation chaperone TorD
MTLPDSATGIDSARWDELAGDARAALVRSDLYRAISWSFLPPDAALFTNVSRTIGNLRRRAGSLPTHTAALAAIEHLEAFNHSTVQRLNFEHDSVFGHTISAECPPYETQYGAGIIFAQTQRLGDVTAFYRAFAMQIAPGAHERQDHVSVELEFMSVLAFREAVAIIEQEGQHVSEVRDAARKFLLDHLAPWALSFAERLGRRAQSVLPPDGGFYAAFASALDALLRDELRLAHVTPEAVGVVEPARVDFEPEGGCFACGAAGEPVLANLPGFHV